MLRVPHRRIAGRAGYRPRLTSHAAVWRGEVNRSRRAWASFGPGEQLGDLGVPSSVRHRGPTDRMVGRPPAPRRGAGGVCAIAAAGQPEPDRPGQDAPLHDPPWIVQRDHGVGVRIDNQLGVVGAPSNTHREPAASTAAAIWRAKPGASSSPKASRSRCRAPSRTASARARVVLPLPAQPITTIRSGIGSVGAGRAGIRARHGAGGGATRISPTWLVVRSSGQRWRPWIHAATVTASGDQSVPGVPPSSSQP
jgi:hypothetical protein